MNLKSISVGKIIRDARSNAGLSQADLATALGYSTPQFVSNWERGVSLPPIKSLKKIGRLLGDKSEDKIAFKLLDATIKYHAENIERMSLEAYRKSR